MKGVAEDLGTADALDEPAVCLSQVCCLPVSSNARPFSDLMRIYWLLKTASCLLFYAVIVLVDCIYTHLYSTTHMLHRLRWSTFLKFRSIKDNNFYCHFLNTSSPPFIKYLLFVTWLVICSPIPCLALPAFSVPMASLSLYALNANGMNHALKLQHINRAIRFRNPAVFIITELKLKTSVIDKLLTTEYNMFEEKSELTTGTWK